MADQIDIDVNLNLNNAEELDELSSQLQAAADSADNLSDSTDNVNPQGIRDAANEAGNLGNETSNADAEVQNLGNDLSLINGVALLDVANEIGQLGQQAEGMSLEMNEAAITVGQLATNTGIAEPQLISMINAMTSADFPHEDALTYVNALNQMGVNASNLQSSATAMDVIGDATGMSAQQVVSLTQSLRGLGVSADNLPASFDAIAFAQANVNGGAETLQAVFKQQAGTMNEYGVSIDQAVVMMQALSEQGVQGRKMGSALSEVLKENEGDMSAVEQQLGLTAGSLTNASSITGEYKGKLEDLASEEGEHKTLLEQVGAVWQDVSLSASGVLSPLGSVMGLIGQAGSFAVGVNGMLELASSLTNVRDMINAVRSAESISQGVKMALAIATGAETAAETGAAAAKGAAIAPTAGLAVAENSLLWPLLLIVGAVIAVIAVMWYLYNTNETVRNGINWLVAQIQGFINMLLPAARGVLTFVTQVGSNLGRLPALVWNLLLRVVTYVGQWVANMVSRGVSGAQNFVSQVASVFGGIVGRITSALSGVVDAITKPFRDAWNYVKPYVDKIQQGLDFINPFSGFEGYAGFEGYSGIDDTLNSSIISSINNNSNSSSLVVNNTFNGLVEESAADYIVGAVNDRLRREKLLRGA